MITTSALEAIVVVGNLGVYDMPDLLSRYYIHPNFISFTGCFEVPNLEETIAEEYNCIMYLSLSPIGLSGAYKSWQKMYHCYVSLYIRGQPSAAEITSAHGLYK